MGTLSIAQGAHEVEPRVASLTAGIALLIMTILAAPINFVVIQNVVVPGNADATAAQIMASATTIRLGAIGLIFVSLLDLIVAWGLYELFRPVNRGLALLGAWMRIVYAALFAVAITNIFSAVSSAPTDAPAALGQFQQFKEGWMIGQIFFGVHLAVVGVLAWRSQFMHRVFGVLLLVAGAGYLTDGIFALVPLELGVEVAMFTFIGEMVFMFWLLIAGPRLTLRSQRA